MPPPPESIAISEFKARCLAVLEHVRRTGRSVLITRRGQPVAEVVPPPAAAASATWIGAMRDTASITGDLVEPVIPPSDWEAEGT